jgi:hypothetical protein
LQYDSQGNIEGIEEIIIPNNSCLLKSIKFDKIDKDYRLIHTIIHIFPIKKIILHEFTVQDHRSKLALKK